MLVRGLLDDARLRQRADVLGLSWGGGIAQQFALQHPDRTGRLALVSTGTGAMMVPARFTVLAKMLTPRRYNDRTYRREAGAEIYQGESQAAVDAVFSRVHPVDVRARTSSSSGAHELDEPAGAPVHRGADAGARRAVATRSSPWSTPTSWARLLPRGTVHLHEGGHLGLLTRPDELGRGARGVPGRANGSLGSR